MEKLAEVISVNPAGESQKAVNGAAGSWAVDTPGERFYAEWDQTSLLWLRRRCLMRRSRCMGIGLRGRGRSLRPRKPAVQTGARPPAQYRRHADEAAGGFWYRSTDHSQLEPGAQERQR